VGHSSRQSDFGERGIVRPSATSCKTLLLAVVMRAIHWVHVPILRIKKTSADFGYYETNAITVKTTEAKLIKMRIKTFGNWLYLKNPKYYVGELSTVDVTLSKSAPTTTTSTGNAAVIIVNICKYAIWD
jgi:hypothetical protein